MAIRQLNEFADKNGYTEISFELMLEYKLFMQKIYKESTLNYKIVAFGSYFNYLEQVRPDFKASEYKIKRVKVQNDNEREYITKSEFNRLLEHCSHGETKMLMRLLSITGLRISEALSLTLEKIEPIKIRVTNKGKTRTIGISDLFKHELRRFFQNKKSTDPIFGLSQTTYRNYMKLAAESANVKSEKVYPHALRHYFAKDFLERQSGERALPKLQRILGHSSITTTMIYLDYNNTEIAEMMMAS